MIFKRKSQFIDLIDFSIRYIGTGEIGGYIINFLYKEMKFSHIGYRIGRNNIGDARCTLVTFNDNNAPIQYFKDRCSGMIEEAVKNAEPIPHEIKRWKNGFKEVMPRE